MNILGINAVFHDSSACLVQDGRITAAAEEERFTRRKKHKDTRPFHAALLPFQAIAYCLEAGGITLAEVDHIGYSFDPASMIQPFAPRHSFTLPFLGDLGKKEYGYDPWNSVFLAGATSAPRLLLDDVPWHLKPRFFSASKPQDWQFHFLSHHLTHAASAYYPAPFTEAAVLTIDGQGGDATTAMYHGKDGKLELLRTVNLPHSLGILYEQLTAYLGFKPSSDEFKVMALASHGTPRFLDVFLEHITLTEGSFTIRPMNLRQLFGSARERTAALLPEHFDIAASLQKALEQTVFHLCRWLQTQTGSKNLVLAGGVALNCVLNGHLKATGIFENIWIQPAAGDSGTALGAALELAKQYDPDFSAQLQMDDAFLGPGFRQEEVKAILDEYQLTYTQPDNIHHELTKHLLAGEVIGLFQGRMEFGPRALGARSIIASPLLPDMQDRLNKIKGRETFRPVAPFVLEEKVSDWFEFSGTAPYMNFVAPVKEAQKTKVPAIVHVDGSARIQTVAQENNPFIHALLTEFEQHTGVPILINTSFNTRGEPIVCTPRDAISSFFTTPIDTLAIEGFLVEKHRG
jgi:carbamoyltransferase